MLFGDRYHENMRIVPQIGIASYLTHFGHEITWVVPSERAKRVQSSVFNGISVIEIPLQRWPKMFERCKIGYGLRRMNTILKIFRERQYDLVFVRDGTFDALLGLYLKKRYHLPFVYELSNPLEQRRDTYASYLNKKHILPFLRIDEYCRAYLMQNADLVLPTTAWMADDFAEKGVEREKMLPFPNGVKAIQPPLVDKKEIHERYHIREDTTIIYIGAMHRERHLDVLINAFAKISQDEHPCHLLMVGDGNDRDHLETIAEERGIKDNIVFTGQVDQDEIPNLIAAADIGVSCIPPLPFFKLSSPIKLFEYMAMQKPVVANFEIPEQKEALEASKGGVLIPFEVDALAEGLLQILRDPAGARVMGENGHSWVMENRNFEKLAKNLEKVYLSLLVQDSRGMGHPDS
ncbi:glycosyltransferase family 4 protein [Methanofollis fontis]|nr:glycosyltransferase family 4 protein [Methanofollis fontis]